MLKTVSHSGEQSWVMIRLGSEIGTNLMILVMSSWEMLLLLDFHLFLGGEGSSGAAVVWILNALPKPLCQSVDSQVLNTPVRWKNC